MSLHDFFGNIELRACENEKLDKRKSGGDGRALEKDAAVFLQFAPFVILVSIFAFGSSTGYWCV